ncbi:ABC-type multidrug transport system, ATPase and permease component [Geosmithia morbida]|uniref:ABC-type multidrug transport system, ATPase and permease component n=1 Tax=Geosmithia morbida TaxID=1094350 RepID=A0A9P4YPF1_9HYPO|nr:ABC-type multidrug transport system, ATPase and permease component [Geosmithia morbida]KAF4119392.1 ABC-type multidrug transport system, ATPase and permease component [Geosmithia morbida]
MRTSVQAQWYGDNRDNNNIPLALHSQVIPVHIEADSSFVHPLAILSLIVLVIFALQKPIRARLPPWLRPFAREQEDVQRPKRPRHTSLSLFALFFGCLGGLAMSLAVAVLSNGHRIANLEVVPWVATLVMVIVDRPVKTPRILLLQFIIMLSAGLARYSTHFLNHTLRTIDPFHMCQLGVCVVAIGIMVNMPIRDPSWDSSEIGSAKSPPSHHLRSPEDNLTLLQFWTMAWVYPLAKLAQTREINVEDVWQLPYEYQHSRLYLAFREVQGRLLHRLVEANGLDVFVSTILAVIEKVAEVSNIRLTSKLYSALDGGDPSEAMFWCLVMFCLDALRQVAKTTSGWYSRKAYERSRGETFIGLFEKLLTRAVPGSDRTEKSPEETQATVSTYPAAGRLSKFSGWLCGRGGYTKISSKPSRQPASNAKVVNLVRGDTYQISQRFWEFPRLISQPIKVIFTLYYLIDIMGWPSCVGFCLIIIFLTINSILVKNLIQMERARTIHSDKRAQAVSHFVEASKPLKLNGWTSSWARRIMKLRDLEMDKRLRMSYVTAAIGTINVLGGATYPLASICLYTLILGRGLPNAVIWPSIQLFAQLESSVREAFELISGYWKSTIPVERVHKYMAEPDRDNDSSWDEGTRDISFSGASFSWPSTDKLVLEKLYLSFPTGLTIIRGKVGSGKSSLLLAALNEMELHDGSLTRPDEPIGYAQQLPWLQNKTIRENILFHQQYNPSRYREVVAACALGPDFSMLPDGDLTKLEEGGVGLSGGQKARVALARAIYSPCRILLLDDPLAALDHDTASLIVRRFLRGPLAQGRTIVMVTHRDDLVLRIADQVVDLDEGRAHVLTQDQIRDELEHPYHNMIGQTAADEADHAHHVDEVAIPEARDAPEEPSKTGGVSLSIYTKYIAAGGLHLWITLALFYALSRLCDIFRARLLEAWGSDTAEQTIGLSGFLGLPDPHQSPKSWLLALAGLSGGQIASYAIAQVLLAHICINAAQGLFRNAIDRVSRATFRYHDSTPTGQLKNRLIADMGMVDGGILSPLESFVFNLITLMLSLVAIMLHQPGLLIILCFAALLFVYFFRMYVPISRCLRRMEMRYLTPIISNIGVMQDGLVTIRALQVEEHFKDRHLDAVDDFQKQDHFFWGMAFWLDFRLSLSSACMRSALIIFMVWYGSPASAVGFVLTQTTIAMGSVQQLCEKFAQLQLDAVSLERVDMLSRIPEEPTGELDPPEGWPRPDDNIKFDGVSFNYDEGMPIVLNDLTFEIPGGSTCAVLGRTGSGKSTIANALLATRLPCEGTVKIGDVDLSQVYRETLRNRVTYVQQDPVLFPGTLRDNIDPDGRFSDQECERAIRSVLGPQWNLDSQIDAAGKNLSQGQRQLVSIGRAVLRRSGLVILDEATASIDRATAAKVQGILRENLSQSTVITIAHRLEAVEDANWCLRLSKGKVLECGPAGNNRS